MFHLLYLGLVHHLTSELGTQLLFAGCYQNRQQWALPGTQSRRLIVAGSPHRHSGSLTFGLALVAIYKVPYFDRVRSLIESGGGLAAEHQGSLHSVQTRLTAK